MKPKKELKKDIFPKLWAEYPDDFFRFFKKNGTLTKEGQVLNQDIKRQRRLRIAQKRT